MHTSTRIIPISLAVLTLFWTCFKESENSQRWRSPLLPINKSPSLYYPKASLHPINRLKILMNWKPLECLSHSQDRKWVNYKNHNQEAQGLKRRRSSLYSSSNLNRQAEDSLDTLALEASLKQPNSKIDSRTTSPRVIILMTANQIHPIRSRIISHNHVLEITMNLRFSSVTVQTRATTIGRTSLLSFYPRYHRRCERAKKIPEYWWRRSSSRTWSRVTTA